MARAIFVMIGILRLSRLRYLSLTIPPFVAGVLGSAHHDARYLWVGILAIVLLRAISSIGNCVSDRVEDAVDHSCRAMLCEQLGYAKLTRLIVGLATVFLALVSVMIVALGTSLVAIVLWLAYLLLKLSYSFGPRLKPKRSSATVLLGGVSGAMFFVGWLGDGTHGGWTAAAGGLVLWTMGASLSGSKDAPNLDGDLKIGYRSRYRDLIEGTRPLRRALAIVSRPYFVAGLIGLLTLTSNPGLSALWCLAVYPLALTFAVILIRARTDTERSLVREFGYLYWLVFAGVVLYSFVSQPIVAAIALGAIAWYVIASMLMHPDPTPYTAADLRVARNVFMGASLR